MTITEKKKPFSAFPTTEKTSSKYYSWNGFNVDVTSANIFQDNNSMIIREPEESMKSSKISSFDYMDIDVIQNTENQKQQDDNSSNHN